MVSRIQRVKSIALIVLTEWVGCFTFKIAFMYLYVRLRLSMFSYYRVKVWPLKLS